MENLSRMIPETVREAVASTSARRISALTKMPVEAIMAAKESRAGRV